MDMSNRFKPVNPWHLDIHEYDIGIGCFRLFNRLPTICRFTDHIYIVKMILNEITHRLSFNKFLFNYQYTHVLLPYLDFLEATEAPLFLPLTPSRFLHHDVFDKIFAVV